MTNTQAQEFKDILEATVAELQQRMCCRKDAVIEGSADRIENAFAITGSELALHKLESNSRALQAAREALSRLKRGTYGICLDCQDQISPKRLVAVPFASLCWRCQETRDIWAAASVPQPAFALAA